MVGHRRNLLFKVLVVINIAVLFYAALYLSEKGGPNVEWMPLTATDGIERNNAEVRFINRVEIKNETETKPSLKTYEEFNDTSQIILSTTSATNKTTSSTASIIDLEKKSSVMLPTEFEESDEMSLDIVEENALSENTLARIRSLLMCFDREFRYQVRQRGEFWVLKNYVKADHGNIQCHETVTYTTHSGYEYLDNVLPVVKRWMGPVSLAIHAPGGDFYHAVNSIRYLRDCLGNGLIKQYVSFHIFFPYKHMPKQIPSPESFLSSSYNCSKQPPYKNTSTTYKKTHNLLYPVNVARNIARDAALTHYIFPSDIELYPSPFLIPRFLNMIARNNKPLNTSSNPRVFPISIFEVDSNVNVPSTKTELKAMLKNKTAIPFHKYVCPDCHRIPMGNQWIDAEETNQMDVFHVGKRQGKFVHWEPIFIGTHQDPYYDERLSWEGKMDKMTQGYVLCVQNYDFMILNNAFLVHKPGIKHYVKDPKRLVIASRQSTFITTHIMQELKRIYGTKKGCAM